jgi:hypothetical protein
VFQSGGDGVRLLGDTARPLQRARLDRCHLIQNHRTGVAVQREVHTVRIRRCLIDMTPPGEDACIDLEPTGKAEANAPTDVVIELNTLEHGNRATAVSLSGISRAQPSRRVHFLRNTVTGGTVGAAHTTQLRLRGNTVDAGSAEVTGAMIRLHGRCADARVEGNQVLAAGQPADGITVGGDAEQVIVVNNEVRTAGLGVDVTASGDTVDVSRNRVHGENQRPGIQVETKGETTHHDIRVEDNVVLDFNRAGIIIGPGPAPDLLESPVVTGNTVDRAGEIPANLIGIQLTGLAGQWHGATIEDNTIGAAIPVTIKGPDPG